ncbi:MAG TPA: sugar ABC transporter permease, partial [Thermomicrobiales bacterium]|nr:sugar ABC transporter permease [Thermomicrobiales bacterium]
MSATAIQVVGTRRAKSARARMDRLWALLFIAPQVVGLVAFAIVPLIFSFVLGFMKWDGLGERAWVGFANFQEQFADPEFRAALRNTLYFTVLTVPTGLALALLVALGVNRIRGKMIYRALYFAPVVTSSVAIAVVWQYLLNGQFGVINAALRGVGLDPPNWLLDTRFVLPAIALVTIWWTLGLNVVIFLAGLQNVRGDLLEAAKVDGANPWQVFRSITLPLLQPTILFASVIAMITGLQVFIPQFVMTKGGPVDATLVLTLNIYETAFVFLDGGKAAAMSVVLFF